MTLVAMPSSVVASPRQEGTEPTSVSNLADCASRTGQLSVVLLVDESASLRKTDPEDRRIEGIQAALASLAQVADRTAGSEVPVSVDVSMMGFGVAATEVVGWSRLDGGTLPGLLSESRRFADRDRQIDTDYAAALMGARDQLAKVVDPSEAGNACTAILWFTDGKYDIEPRSTGETKPYAPEIAINGAESATALEEAGKRVLCQEGGLIDGLRLDGTEILAVALSAQIEPVDQDFLRAVAEATGPQSCGVARPAGAAAPGAYLGADDISGLITAFFDTISEAGGGTAGPAGSKLPVCPNTGCESGTHHFPVDPGILTFNLLAVSSAAGIDVELASPEPGSQLLPISPSQSAGESDLGSATVRWTWVSAEAVLVDVTMPADEGPWHGNWSVTFIDRAGTSPGAVADAHIYVFGDLEPYVEVAELRAGEDNQLKVGVRHRQGSPVDESLFADVELEALVVNPGDGTRERVELGDPGPDGMRSGTWGAPAPDFPATVNISVTARITTESGQALTPVTRTVAVDVLPPSSYPSIEPGSLRFPTVTGIEATEVTVTVRGGDDSGGCVWLEATDVTQAPEDAGKVAIIPQPNASSKETCLHVEAGESKTLRLQITPTSATNGSAAGTIDVALTSDTNPDLLRTELGWSVPLQKPLDTEVRNRVFAILMAAGLLLPLLLMWFLNWVTARFDEPSGLKYATVRTIVSKDGKVFRTDEKETGLGVRPDDFKALNVSGRPRAFDGGPVRFTSRTPRSPFAAPHGEASALGFAVGSLPPASVGRSLGKAPVAFGLAGTAVVLVPEATLVVEDEKRPDLEVTLVLFAPAAELSRYTTHFDGHRSTVKAVVDTMWERSRAARAAQAEAAPVAAVASDPPGPSSDRPVGRMGSGAEAPVSTTDRPPGRTVGGLGSRDRAVSRDDVPPAPDPSRTAAAPPPSRSNPDRLAKPINDDASPASKPDGSPDSPPTRPSDRPTPDDTAKPPGRGKY